jgi:hypothetical protein
MKVVWSCGRKLVMYIHCEGNDLISTVSNYYSVPWWFVKIYTTYGIFSAAELIGRRSKQCTNFPTSVICLPYCCIIVHQICSTIQEAFSYLNKITNTICLQPYFSFSKSSFELKMLYWPSCMANFYLRSKWWSHYLVLWLCIFLDVHSLPDRLPLWLHEITLKRNNC